MASLLFHSNRPTVLLRPLLTGCRIATYADLATPALARDGQGRLIWIDRGYGDPLDLATVADLETGDLALDDAAGLIDRWYAQGRPFPTVYCAASDWTAVSGMLAGRHAYRWSWAPDGTLAAHGTVGAAVHFAGEAQLDFGAEVSVVWDESWNPVSRMLTGAQTDYLQQLAADATSAVARLAHAVSTLERALRRARFQLQRVR